MRIVDVCAFYTPHGGGVKTYAERKLRAGPANGHEIIIVAPGDTQEVRTMGPRARLVTVPSPRRAPSSPRSSWRAARLTGPSTARSASWP